MGGHSEAVPLCVDCEHHSLKHGHHMCNWRVNPVTGGPGGFADNERMYAINGSCGLSGSNFRPRKGITARFMKVIPMFKARQ